MNEHVLLASLKTVEKDIAAARNADNLGMAHQAMARADVLLQALIALAEEKQQDRIPAEMK